MQDSLAKMKKQLAVQKVRGKNEKKIEKKSR